METIKKSPNDSQCFSRKIDGHVLSNNMWHYASLDNLFSERNEAIRSSLNSMFYHAFKDTLFSESIDDIYETK